MAASILKIILVTLLISTIVIAAHNSEKYDTENALSKFYYYKWKFNRQYRSKKAKKRAFINFVRTLKEVNELNQKYMNDTTMYALNKYADVDPSDLELFGVKVLPYDNVRAPKSDKVNKTEMDKMPLEERALYGNNKTGFKIIKLEIKN